MPRLAAVSSNLLASLVALLSLACLSPPFVGSVKPWGRSNAFVSGLRCQMTEADVEAHIPQFPKMLLHRPYSYPHELVAQKGDTMVTLEMNSNLLQAYQISWTSGFTKKSSRLKYDLCEKRYLVEMWLVSSREYGGAAVWLNGVLVGRLDGYGDFARDIPLGIHEFRIERPGLGTWVMELRYDESSQGHDRIPIEVMTKLD